MGCDSVVALAPATHDAVTRFAKNSDRPPRECQRLVRVPHARHAPGSRVRCQYVEIPQVAETATVLGSQPWWLWGFEHGVNEHRVAIGNQTVFARESLGGTGLLGMDLVRLALERARSATYAVEVIGALIETHGQGGSGHVDVDWPYHNAFLVTDPYEGWVVETSARHWVARRATGTAHVTNGLAMGADWDRGAADVTSFAVAQGWWRADAGPVDFAAAYRDDSGVPPNLCTERRRRAQALLARGHGAHSDATLRALLRDHSAEGAGRVRVPFEDERFFTLCMHADPLDNTTAAMVVALPASSRTPVAVWACLGSPCVGAFLPCYLEAPLLPAALVAGGREPDPASGWWRMRELSSAVEVDVARRAPLVRARFDAFETALADRATAVEAEAARSARAPLLLGEFMAHTVDAWLAEIDALIREVNRL
jgi:dipeptidase